jgi:WD40 repeat protein
MADAYTDLLLRVFPYDESGSCYPVEAELSDGSRFTGGELRLDRQALLALQLDAQGYGLALFSALFAGDIRRAYDKVAGIAETATGGRLRVRLWIDKEAVELHAIPWERLYHLDKGRPAALATATLTPFSRYTSLEIREPPPIAESPIRILAAVANPLNLPGGLAPANVDLEIENLRKSLADLRQDNKVHVTLLPGRTGLSPALQSKLESEGYEIVEGVTNLFNIAPRLAHCHIFHFVGHGAFRRAGEHGEGQAALYLEKADGAWQAVKDEEIESMLAAVGTLPHLIFLVACESAKRDPNAETPFVGLGPKLVRAGVPAVVAMQEQVPVEMARLLSGEFYKRLAEHGEVDRALNQARRQVFDARRTDWAIPVLFMRIKSGRLFGAELDEETPAPGEPPFKGLQYFSEHDADKFYGREMLTARLVGQLRESRFLPVIIGASGSGKSSVVRAGVLPALKRGEPLADGARPPEGSPRWPVHVITPTAQPLEALAASLTRQADAVSATTALVEDLLVDPRTLHFYARKLLSRAAGGADRLLLVVDQFEEIFTLCKDETARKAFINNLLHASAPETDGPTIVIIVFRADFYAHCAQYHNLREAVSRRQEFVGPMTRDELRRAIEEPAKAGGWDLEPGLVDVLLKDVGDEPGALPLLSHALLETWKRRRGRMMTLRGYAESGGVRGAIAKTAESVYQQLPGEQKPVARRIFLQLVELGEGTQDTRRRAPLADLAPRPQDQPVVEAVLNTLVANRLVTTTASTAEVAHEALIREWPTLREWINQGREAIRIHRELAAAAKEWDGLFREPGALLRGVKLIQAREWAEEHGDEMSDLERDFLTASYDAAQREIREREERQQRELENAKRIAEEQARAAEAAQQAAQTAHELARTAQELAEAEKQRREDQARSATQLRQRNRWITLAGVIALALAVAAAWLGNAAQQQNYIAQTEAARAEAASTQAGVERENAQENAATAEAASTQALEERATAVAAEAEAQRQRGEAELQAELALVRQLVAQSGGILRVYPQRSLLLALEALSAARTITDVTPAEARSQQQLAEDTLRRALVNTGGRVLSGHTGAVLATAVSPDNQWLVTTAGRGEVLLWELSRLGAETVLEPIPLTGHERSVTVAGFSADGRWLVTAGDDGFALLWDMTGPIPDPSPIKLEGHTGAIRAVAFSPDPENSRWLVTGGADGAALVWDVAAPLSPARTLRGHTDDVLSVAVSPNGRWAATGSEDNTARLWFLPAVADAVVLRAHVDDVRLVAFSPDGNWLATGSRDASARLWDMNSANIPLSSIPFYGHEEEILSIAFSPDGRWFATGSFDTTAILWDLDSPELRDAAGYVLRGHTDQVVSIAFTPDGRWLITGSRDATARLWDVTDPAQFLAPIVLRGHERPIRAIAVSQDHHVITVSEDNTARVWGIYTPDSPAASILLYGHASLVRRLAFSSDNHWLATGSVDGTVRLWDLTAKEPAARPLILRGHQGAIYDLAISRDSRWLASGAQDNNVALWDLAAIGPESRPILLRGHVSAVRMVAFSSDGHWLVSVGRDGRVYRWDLTAPDVAQAFLQLRAHTDQVRVAEVSENGEWLITGGDDRTPRLWFLNDPDPNATVITLDQHAGSVRAVGFSRNNRWLVTGGDRADLRLWDLTPLNFHAAPTFVPLIGHNTNNAIRDVVFTPDNHWLVTGSGDTTIRLWNMNTVGVPESFVVGGHNGEVRSLDVSEDNRWLISGSEDNTARLWGLVNPEPNERYTTLSGHEGPVWWVAISKDGQWFATGSGDSTARLWGAVPPIEAVIDLACRAAGRNLTPDEWALYLGSLPYRGTCAAFDGEP